jgi:oxygen-independent coproporphyrinogen-3 oxidase
VTRLDVDQDLVLRMARPGPRYTSYPTAPEWRDDFGDGDGRAALARAAERAREPLALYVHLPFCERLCLFCGCTVEITRRAERVERYLETLETEIARAAELLGERRAALQLHLGGGTPTHLTPEQLVRLHRAIAGHFELAPDAEISIEVHPRVTTAAHVDALAELGFRRISLGVQDLDPIVQAAVRRDQTAQQTIELVRYARQRGFTGVNLDLMYGLPAQTEATFAATLDAVAAMRPDRLAVYAYAHVPWLKPAQRALERADLPGPLERARLFLLALERLGTTGYEVIGLDHFALRDDPLYQSLEDGTLHRNFMGYTAHPAAESVAFGMSAIGDLGGAFLQNARDTRDWEQRVQSGRLGTARGLWRSRDDELRRAAIQSIMCRMRLDQDELERAFGPVDFAAEWRALEPLARQGLCTLEPRRLTVLPLGRLFLRHLAMVFDAYLPGDRAPGAAAGGEPRFSQTV